MIEIELRESIPTDESFIYNSWLESYKENNKDFLRMAKGVYYSNYKKIIESILKSSTTVIAHNPEDKDQIYGYIVSDIDLGIVHYIYVKYTFRKWGIARELLKNVHPLLGEDPLICTFANKNYDILKNKYLLTYNPFLR